ncbi:uncharacterized protein LOC110648778 isoform X3 [Hevea brasiliensis]|uniref:uncharacterized protein LOC110648778 isoform X3 n=1 Tax=Hevea brasiliensis TaxID=3981 RepID=UPI0025CC70BF|nr:uncharacterized protein LOC110648778 isoform X3 [Hevea brasiliensis]
MHLSYCLTKPNSIAHSRFSLSPYITQPRFPFSHITPTNKLTSSVKIPLNLIPRCSQQDSTSVPIIIHANQFSTDKFIRNNQTQETQQEPQKNFWGAVSLVIGTAVGPGMLGLPAATIRSGSCPSIVAIFLCWVYVISSIILVAELSFAAMQEDGVSEVIDTANRVFCLLMLLSITALVGIGLSVARTNVLGSLAKSSWSISSILPAIPVTVLTLGFHVITPFICKIAGNTVSEARKAVLIGGVVPLIMVLSWNLIVLGLSGANTAASSNDPISLLLSVNPSALSAVQGFAFSALATSLIGYAVSFPKQLLDTLDLVFMKINSAEQFSSQSQMLLNGDGTGRVGLVIFSGRHYSGNSGRALFDGSKHFAASEDKLKLPSRIAKSNSFHQTFVTMLVLSVPILIGSFFRSTFSKALDFAGVYANCFLFGILPPVMAYVQQSRKKLRSSFQTLRLFPAIHFIRAPLASETSRAKLQMRRTHEMHINSYETNHKQKYANAIEAYAWLQEYQARKLKLRNFCIIKK